MPLQATSGAASYDGFGGGVPFTPTYIEDVFSTWLYTGNGSTQTITNGIDLSTKGGMLWIKSRSDPYGNTLWDTARGANKLLSSNQTWGDSVVTTNNSVNSFNTNGFTLGSDTSTFWVNESAKTYASWTFRKQPKFFDVVTYTGNGTAGRTVAHSLGSDPGCIIIKRTDLAEEWVVYHRSLGTSKYMRLASNAGEFAVPMVSATSATNFTLTSNAYVNDSGGTYVAYIFAHNAGGFGLTGTDNVISCGSFTTNGSALSGQVELGWEPQWLLIKRSTGGTGNWMLVDNMRGVTATGNGAAGLYANLSNAEDPSRSVNINATGFSVSGDFGTSSTSIYIAIRRGPMKTPTDATKVFMPTVYTGTNVDNRLVDTTIAPDMVWVRERSSTTVNGMVVGDRMRGQPYWLTGTTDAEVDDADAFDQQLISAVQYGNAFSSMNGYWCGNDPTARLNNSTVSNDIVAEAFKRAPGFFDVVCYTGTGVARTITHNLGAAPQFYIVKHRNGIDVAYAYFSSLGAQYRIAFGGTSGPGTSSATWNDTEPTSTVFSVGTLNNVNASGETYVAYLFANCPGVSKVGSYTGTGTTLQIDCGFTNGARFVMIKRTDSTGGWYVWDSARGIVAGNDPYVLLNSTAAEVTNTDYIDTYSAGFEISSTAPAAINANGGTFVFLAVA